MSLLDDLNGWLGSDGSGSNAPYMPVGGDNSDPLTGWNLDFGDPFATNNGLVDFTPTLVPGGNSDSNSGSDSGGGFWDSFDKLINAAEHVVPLFAPHNQYTPSGSYQDVQQGGGSDPNAQAPSDTFFTPTNILLIGGGAVVLLGGAYMLTRSRKRK